MFKQNMGAADRAVRIAVGIILAALGMLVLKGMAANVVSIVALIPLITGIVGFCPSYVPFRFSTVKTR